ncbi:MAG: hypothetical protein QOG79_4903 [Mycobacterium sp.]|nr:hypothetical protein [Mycobacterium sp.]
MTATSCRKCGTELLQSARFCHMCGSPSIPSYAPAEYKQVTILFADVVHSMDIAVALGAERLREIMTCLFNRSAVIVQRRGGTVDKFTGDGIMALFGAPAALEDHALRACLAALGIQEEAQRLAAEVARRDGVDLQLRIGLNSGRVITGDIGSSPTNYTAIGEQVGMSQRMESVAPPGGVMLSESTARLVEHVAVLGQPEIVHIKGAAEPVPARRLLTIAAQPGRIGRSDTTLVGRQREMKTVTGMLSRVISGHGCVVGVAGPAGIGKSRLVSETAAIANSQGIEVFGAFCESHTKDLPFHVVARLLRAVSGIGDLEDGAARAPLRTRFPDADPQDLLLLDDLLGIADPDVALPRIDPDARRRRLTALISAMALARTGPVLYVIEDAHWVDEVSESMLADFLAVIPETQSMVLTTFRPEYRGALTQAPDAHTVVLAPLNDSETTALLGELLGPDPSVGGVTALVSGRAAGNPFFAEEMVRELAERGVLEGDRGSFVCRAEITEVSVPATLQAVIAARIDRLKPAAKRTLNAAAVIGSRFSLDLLPDLGIEPVLDELVTVELIDQLRFTPRAEYAFRHPLIRSVAYGSQLKSDRAALHRRAAAAIEARDPGSADENAALIADHLEAAGNLHGAYGWHMRAANWSTNRDIVAAHLSWERARQVADSLPTDDPNRTATRIASRTLLCSSAWRVHASISGRFEELRQLCTLAEDKASLAIGMAGLVREHTMHARVREASRLASEYMALVESIGDSTLTVGAATAAIHTKLKTGELVDVLRWSQTVIDLAEGDPTKGNFSMGSPLAAALVYRGFARFNLGLRGWREDFDDGVAVARGTDPMAHAAIVNAKYGPAIPCGVLLPHDAALREIEEALRIAERSAEDVALGSARMALGVALVHRDSTDRERGLKLLEQVGDMCLHERFVASEAPWVEVYIARERARRGDRDGAVPMMRNAVNELFERGQLAYCVPTTGVLVETLLARGTAGDVAEAEAAMQRLAAAPADDGWVMRDITLLRLRALVAHTRGEEMAYRELVEKYRAMAASLGFEGHIAWAGAMT